MSCHRDIVVEEVSIGEGKLDVDHGVEAPRGQLRFGNP